MVNVAVTNKIRQLKSVGNVYISGLHVLVKMQPIHPLSIKCVFLLYKINSIHFSMYTEFYGLALCLDQRKIRMKTGKYM